MSVVDYALQELLLRARGDFLHMPRLHLTVREADELWGLGVEMCDAVLSCLVATGFLRRTRSGVFALAVPEGKTTPAMARPASGAKTRSPDDGPRRTAEHGRHGRWRH